MLTLLSECHFWTCREEKIRIKDYDLGAYRYYTNQKREFDGKDLIALGKKEYNEQRDGIVILTNRKNTRLKDNLKKLEELIKMHKIIKTDWKNGCVVQMLLDNGIIIHICVNNFTGDILRIAFDKFFVGKLAPYQITDAIFSRQNILLSYNTNQVTVVHLQKPTMRRSSPEKISNMDPKIYHVLIPGSADKKLARNLAVNRSFDLVIAWTKSSQNELYPWKPTYLDQDRANMHVFKLREDRLEAIGFCWTENEPLCMQFLRTDENKIITVEQKISRKGEISADICVYGILKGRLQKITSHSIPIGSQIASYNFSPDQERLFLGTVDHCVCIYDISRQKTKFLPKTEIAPQHCSWHSDSTIVLLGNNFAQMQFFDFAFNPIMQQFSSEQITPTNIIDISRYFVEQPKLLSACFSAKIDRKSQMNYALQSDFFLLLLFEQGPIVCLRFYGSGLKTDNGICAETLINRYLSYNQLDKAVNLLLCSNWETNGSSCMLSLNKICNYVLTRENVKRSRNDLMKKALRSFTDQLGDDCKDEFGDQVIDLRRRFFFFLLRNKLYTECLEVAKTVLDYDLFMDLFNCTKTDPNLISITHEAYHQAEKIVNQSEKDSKSSKTSDDSEKPSTDNENDTTSTASSIPSCPDLANQTKFRPTFTKDAYRRRSLSAGREYSGAAKTNKYNYMYGKSKDDYFRNPAPQHLKVKRLHKEHFDEIDFTISSSKNYIPPLQTYKSPVNKAASIKITKPMLEVPDSPNVSNGCFRMLKKPKDSLLKHTNKSNIKDEIDTFSSISAVTGRPLRNQYSLSDISTNRMCKRSLELYAPSFSATVSQSNFSEQNLGIPLCQVQGPQSFQPSVFNAQPQLIPRPSRQSSHTVVSRTGMSPERLAPIRDLNLNNPLNEGATIRPHITQAVQGFSTSPPKYPLNNTIGVPSTLQHTDTTSNEFPHPFYTPKYYQHPLVLGHIPSSNQQIDSANSTMMQSTLNMNSNSKKQIQLPSSSNLTGNILSTNFISSTRFEARKDISVGEKNKVKFSDTVHVALMTDLSHKEKPVPIKRNGLLMETVKPISFVTDPEKELAESLPLCNPNDEYLKDFNLMNAEKCSKDDSKVINNGNFTTDCYQNSLIDNNSNFNQSKDNDGSSNANVNNNNNINNNNNNDSNNNNGSTIKVVHFGIV